MVKQTRKSDKQIRQTCRETGRDAFQMNARQGTHFIEKHIKNKTTTTPTPSYLGRMKMIKPQTVKRDNKTFSELICEIWVVWKTTHSFSSAMTTLIIGL